MENLINKGNKHSLALFLHVRNIY